MRKALIALAILVAAPAAAEDCSKYANALAYNACLAAHGPKARAVHVGAAPAPRRRVVAKGKRARSSMVFSVAK